MSSPSAADVPPDSDVPRRPGRPRKEQKAEPSTATMRVSLEMLRQIEEYQQGQIRRTGEALPRKDLVENAWRDFFERRGREPVDLTLLSKDERATMLRLLRYLSRAPQGDPHRKIVCSMLTVLDGLVKVALRFRVAAARRTSSATSP